MHSQIYVDKSFLIEQGLFEWNKGSFGDENRNNEN